MSIRVMSEVWLRYPAGGTERLLALALADHASDDGTRVYPSVAELARKTVQSERSVQRQLKAMVDRGWLILDRRSSGRPGDTNRYHISPVWLGGKELPDVHTGDKLTPVEPCAQSCVSPVDKVIHTGDKTGETGDTAMSPEPSIEPSFNTPQPPVGTGGQFENLSPNSQTAQTAEQPKQPVDQESSGHNPDVRPAWRWHQSRSGIERVGEQLGVGKWDEAAFNAGHGEHWPTYRAKVLTAYEQHRGVAA